MLGKRKLEEDSERPSKKRKKYRTDLSFAFHQIEYNEYVDISGIRSISPSPFHIETNMVPIAISRMNGSIEIWILPSHNPLNIIQFCSFPHKFSTTIQRIKWYRPTQIVTAGLQGSLTVWDIPTKLPIRHQTSHGGAIWDMDLHRNSVIIGCELGNVRHFTIDSNGSFIIQRVYTPAQSQSSLNRETRKKNRVNSNRILTVKFHPDGDRFLCGGFHGVHCFKIGSSQYLYRTMIETNPCSSLCWLPASKSFAIGDARGNVHICDDQFGTIIGTMKSHDHNVLEIVNDGRRMFSSGVDGKLNLFECGSPQNRWFLSSSRRPSYHDLFGLFEIRKFVFSGGIDTRLLVTPKHDFSNEKTVKNYTFNWYPCSEEMMTRFCEEKRILCTYNQKDTFHFLSIPEVLVRKTDHNNNNINSNSDDDIPNLGRIPFVESPKCMYRIPIGKLTDWGVNDFDVSSNGEYFGFVSYDTLRIFGLKYGNANNNNNGEEEEEENEGENENENDDHHDNKIIRGCELIPIDQFGVGVEKRGCKFRFLGDGWILVASPNNNNNNNDEQKEEEEEIAKCMFYKTVTSVLVKSKKWVVITFGTRVSVYEIIDLNTVREYWKFKIPSTSSSSSRTRTRTTRRKRKMDDSMEDEEITCENVIYSSGWIGNIENNNNNDDDDDAEFYILMTGQKMSKFSIPQKKCLLSNFIIQIDSRKVLGVIRKVFMFGDQEILFSTTKSLYLAKYKDNRRTRSGDNDDVSFSDGDEFTYDIEKIQFIDVNEKKLSNTFYSSFLTSNYEIILLKNNWNKQMFQLPPVSWRKRFGT